MNHSESVRRITSEKFVRGLLASLVLHGENTLSTNGEHQKRFRRMVGALDDPTMTTDTTRGRFPTLTPSPFTGRFAEFDAGILASQTIGLTDSTGPYFQTVNLTISPEHAERILEKFGENERKLFMDLGEVYLEEIPTS